jgi:hypothetical protein
MLATEEKIVSSYSIVRGALIEETYAVMAAWDFDRPKRENLDPFRNKFYVKNVTYSMLREVTKVLGRRFDPAGPDRALVTLAKSGCDLEEWKPILLWHLSRREFVLRDFLIYWLFPTCYDSQAYQLQQEDLHSYFIGVAKRGGKIEQPWSATTLNRVSNSLLKIAGDFGLLMGSNRIRHFASYQLPERSFIYLVHAMREKYESAQKMVQAPEWRMFLLLPSDIERELLRLQGEGKLTYRTGPGPQLVLSSGNAGEYAEQMVEFAPGDRCEVDYAEEKIEWLEPFSRKPHTAHVFLGVLGFSQLIFAWASEDDRGTHWLHAHRKMFEAFGGVPRMTISGCPKQGVIKPHRYDPQNNPGYAEIAAHYVTNVVPAKPECPRDRELVSRAAKFVMRVFRFLHSNHTFTSIAEINHALTHVVDRINRKARSTKSTSRMECWAREESPALRPLPAIPFEAVEWKLARVHADSTVSLESAYYSVPFQHRGKSVRIKLTPTHIEIFRDLESVALHERDFARRATRHAIPEHLPENETARGEALPQKLLTQARDISGSLHAVVEKLFVADTLGNLRRVQRLIRRSQDEIQLYGRGRAEPRIHEAIEQMVRNDNFRVHYFEAILHQLRQQPGTAEDPEAKAAEIPLCH